jgi:hypothetical protein
MLSVSIPVGSLVFVLTMAVAAAGPVQRPGGAGASANQPVRQSIVGRVTDATGQPILNTYLTLLRDQTADGTTRKTPVSVRLYAASNEKGFYHFDNLQPGDYYVVALPQIPLHEDVRASRSANRITYFPGVARAADAKAVTVTPAVPVRADITMVPTRLVAVSGSVIGSSGRPISGGPLLLAHGDGLFGIDDRRLSVGRDGTFAVLLPPGKYHLHYREDASIPLSPDGWKVSGATLVVADRDLSAIRVAPIKMVTVTGRVVIDPSMRDLVKRGGIRIGASPVDFDGNPGPQMPGTVKDDLTFEFRTWPSRGIIRIQVERRELVPRAVRINGGLIDRRNVAFAPGGALSGLEIDLRAQPTPDLRHPPLRTSCAVHSGPRAPVALLCAAGDAGLSTAFSRSV